MSGIIYALGFPNQKLYVGQTTKSFEQRMNAHKSSAANLNKKDGCRALNNAIRTYGWDNIDKTIIEYCEHDQLDELESYYINYYETLSPKGYNLMTGGNSNKTYSDESKLLQREAALKRDVKIYRKNEITMDWPKHLGLFNGYPRITKHPKCSSKGFNDPKKTFEENLEDAKEFLELLNSGEIEVIIPPRELPKGIQKMGNGYRVHIKKDGKVITKNFANQAYSAATLLENAKEFLEHLNDT